MANIITAGNSTNGGTQITTDTSGTLNIVTGSGSGANAITIDTSQNVTFANAITTTGNGTIGGALAVTGNATITGTLTATGGISNGNKAWVSFVGSTGSINASGNVSSITRNGTGDYTVNFTSALADANYAAVVSCRPNTAGAYGAGVALFATGTTGSNPTSSAFRFTTVSTGGSAYDPSYVTAIVAR
jgi:hypothetical protein